MEENTTQPFPRLTGRRLKAFQMKFEGEPYQKIAIETHYSESWIRQCFTRGGKWHAHYNNWEDKLIEDIEAEGRKRIKKRIAEALTVQEHNLTIVSTNPREAGRAARDILDRAGLKAPEKIEITDPDDKAEKMLKALEQRKAKRQQTTATDNE